MVRQDEVEDDDYPSTILSKETSIVKLKNSSDNSKDKAVDAPRNKIIRQLIDMSTPTNSSKQKLFDNLVSRKDNTKVILEMAIDMGSSVDDTKTMLMNHCI